MAGAKRRKGLFHQMARAHAARKVVRLRRAKAGGRTLQAARGGSLLGRAAGAARSATPVGALIAAGVVAAAVATRLATGRSFENLGEQVNQILLGDMDDEARASAAASRHITGDRDLARIIGIEGRVNSQIARLHKDMKALHLRDEVGATAIRQNEGMSHNGMLDMLIVRGHAKFMEAWNGTGGPQATEKFRGKYRETLQTAGKGGAR